MLVFAYIRHVFALKHLVPCVLYSFHCFRVLEGRDGSLPFIDIFAWAMGRTEPVVENQSRWRGMNFAAAAQFTQSTRLCRIYSLSDSISAAAKMYLQYCWILNHVLEYEWKRKMFLFCVLHSLSWTPDLSQIFWRRCSSDFLHFTGIISFSPIGLKQPRNHSYYFTI